MNENVRYNNFKSFFLSISRPYLIWFIGLLFVVIYTSAHSVLQPYILKVLLDSAEKAKQGEFLSSCLKPGIFLILLALSMTLTWRFYYYVLLKSLPKIKADIIKITTSHLRTQSFNFFQENLSGSLSAKISDLTYNVQQIVSSWFNILRQGLIIILSILMADVVSPIFSLMFLSISFIFVVISYYCSLTIKPYASEYANARTKNLGNVVDGFVNIINMFLFSREQYEAQYLNKSTDFVAEKDAAMQYKNMQNSTLLGWFTCILLGSSIIMLLYLGDKGKISVGDFAFIFILSITIIEQIWYLTESILAVVEQTGICEQAIKTIFSENTEKSIGQEQEFEILNGKISVQNVTFGYDAKQIIFKDLSLDIPAGYKVGLVGYSGAGKSTLVQLITRLYEIENGKILIDGADIKSINKQKLREQISFIPQLPNLFHRSIYDNILYGNINASYEDVLEASKKAYVHDFIKVLPNGYETVIGEKGLKLSGGQRQQIAIARAILKDAPILILDEATSSLDSITEKLLQDSLKIAMENRTVIVIAHKLSTILSMDKIFVMDNGRIIESGTHKNLIEANGFYKMLWDRQSGHSFI